MELSGAGKVWSDFEGKLVSLLNPPFKVKTAVNHP